MMVDSTKRFGNSIIDTDRTFRFLIFIFFLGGGMGALGFKSNFIPTFNEIFATS